MLRFETLAHTDTSVIQPILSSTNATKTVYFFTIGYECKHCESKSFTVNDSVKIKLMTSLF